MNEIKLSNEIQAWLDHTESNKNRWNQSPVGLTIKNGLKKSGNWKERARWIPPKTAIQDNLKKHESKQWEETTDTEW